MLHVLSSSLPMLPTRTPMKTFASKWFSLASFPFHRSHSQAIALWPRPDFPTISVLPVVKAKAAVEMREVCLALVASVLRSSQVFKFLKHFKI